MPPVPCPANSSSPQHVGLESIYDLAENIKEIERLPNCGNPQRAPLVAHPRWVLDDIGPVTVHEVKGNGEDRHLDAEYDGREIDGQTQVGQRASWVNITARDGECKLFYTHVRHLAKTIEGKDLTVCMKSSPTISLNATSFNTILWLPSRTCMSLVNLMMATTATVVEIARAMVN